MIFDENENLFYSGGIFIDILICQKLICENFEKCNLHKLKIMKTPQKILPLLDLK